MPPLPPKLKITLPAPQVQGCISLIAIAISVGNIQPFNPGIEDPTVSDVGGVVRKALKAAWDVQVVKDRPVPEAINLELLVDTIEAMRRLAHIAIREKGLEPTDLNQPLGMTWAKLAVIITDNMQMQATAELARISHEKAEAEKAAAAMPQAAAEEAPMLQATAEAVPSQPASETLPFPAPAVP